MTDDAMFKKSVHFEWVIEHVDIYDDIQEHDFNNNLSDALFRATLDAVLSGKEYHEGLTPRLALIRDYGSEAEGLINRAYAYAYKSDNGAFVMPAETDLGHKVPERFKTQLLRAQER